MNTSIKRIAYTLCTLLSLVLFNSSAKAEWVLVTGSTQAEFHVENTTMRRTGDIVKFWVLIDHKSIQKHSNNINYLSSKHQYLINCKEEEIRLVFAVFYSGQMNQGDTLSSTTFTEKEATWQPLIPGSVREAFGIAVCKAAQ